jgi:hypothetical protein
MAWHGDLRAEIEGMFEGLSVPELIADANGPDEADMRFYGFHIVAGSLSVIRTTKKDPLSLKEKRKRRRERIKADPAKAELERAKRRAAYHRLTPEQKAAKIAKISECRRKRQAA